MSYWRDFAERVVATYVEAFVGLLIVSWPADVNWTVVQVAAWSAVPAGLAAVKAGAAKYVGDPGDAALVNTAKSEDELL